MAKQSSMNKDKRLRRLVAQHAPKRARLKALVNDAKKPLNERMAAAMKLAQMPRKIGRAHV